MTGRTVKDKVTDCRLLGSPTRAKPTFQRAAGEENLVSWGMLLARSAVVVIKYHCEAPFFGSPPAAYIARLRRRL